MHVSTEELFSKPGGNISSQVEIIEELTSCIGDRILVESSLTTKYHPSSLAAAALYIARSKSGVKACWTSTLEHYTGFREKDLGNIIEDISGAFALEAVTLANNEKMKKILSTSDTINSNTTILNGCRNKHGDETYGIVINSYSI